MAAIVLEPDPITEPGPSLVAESIPMENPEHDPTARTCGWCYVNLHSNHHNYTACSNCPRLYCSSTCCQLDQSTHSFWCGKVGEKDVDYEVRPIAGKGLGLIALRSFQRGEKILAESPVATTTNVVVNTTCQAPPLQTQEEVEQTNDNIFRAAMTLTPLDGDLHDKFNSNGVSIKSQDAETHSNVSSSQIAAGLFLTFSRANHDCLGNSDHYFDHQHGVELLVANDAIPAGTEITFPYTRTGKQRKSDLHWRGFDCTCRACQSPSLDDKVNQMSEMDLSIIRLGSQSEASKRAEAVQLARTLLLLYDEVNASCRDYARIHYDLFQILVVQKASLEEAQHHMVQAYQYALSFCGYEGHETVRLYKGYVDHPESHGNYRAID